MLTALVSLACSGLIWWAAELLEHQPAMAAHWSPLLILLLALCFSAVLTALVYSLTRNQDEIRRLAHDMAGNLRESETRFRALGECAPIGIWRSDPEGLLTYVNPAGGAILGLVPESLLGLGFADYIVPGDRPWVVALWQASVQNRQPLDAIHGMALPSLKDIRTVHVQALPEFNAAGQYTGHVGVVIDITEQVAERQHLAEREEHFRLLANAAPVGIYQSNLAGEVEFVNEYWTQKTGMTLEYIKALSWIERVHPDDREAMLAENLRNIAAGLPSEMEFRMQQPDGTWMRVHINEQPIRDAQGQITGWIGTALDTTTQHAAQAALAEREAYFKQLANAAPVGIFRTDPDGRVTFVNDYWSQLTGVGLEIAGGFNWQGLLHPDEAETVMEVIEHSISHQEPYAIELRLRTAGGDHIWVLAKGETLWDDQGLFLGWLGTVVDISERQAVMQDLQAAHAAQELHALELERMILRLEEARARAEEASRAKSAFLANMSHELRTPLNAIMGYSEMLQEMDEPLTDPQVQEDLRRINSAGRHLLGLINDILDLSKIEAGRMLITPEEFQLEDLLVELQGTILPLAQARQNNLQVQVPQPLGLVFTDPLRVRQILLNLLSNACKFTEGGQVSLTVRREQGATGSWLEFVVWDTGIGIPADKLPLLFQDFTQADNSTTRRFGGTGLGLALSRRFARLLGGDIVLDSAAGQGTTCTLRLPVRIQPLLADPAPAPAELASPGKLAEVIATAAHQGSGLILIIDDDPNARDLLARTFIQEGYEVAQAASGTEGLALALELHPSLITLDVLMPGCDGWQTLTWLKAEPATADIPVVMVSMLDEKEHGIALGAEGYLTKPVARAELQQILRQHTPHQTGTVLLVEDQPETRDIICRMLTAEGWTVATAADGLEALRAIDHALPDLLLLDLLLPQLDGFTVLSQLRSRPAWCQVPVVVLTQLDLTPPERRMLASFGSEILAKSALTRETLICEIQRVLISQAARREARHGSAPAAR